MEQRIQTLRNLGEFHPRAREYLLQIFITVYEFPFVTVLELVRLYVLPERGDDDRSRLRVDT